MNGIVRKLPVSKIRKMCKINGVDKATTKVMVDLVKDVNTIWVDAYKELQNENQDLREDLIILNKYIEINCPLDQTKRK